VRPIVPKAETLPPASRIKPPVFWLSILLAKVIFPEPVVLILLRVLATAPLKVIFPPLMAIDAFKLIRGAVNVRSEELVLLLASMKLPLFCHSPESFVISGF
jgi:hypothetical protein